MEQFPGLNEDQIIEGLKFLRVDSISPTVGGNVIQQSTPSLFNGINSTNSYRDFDVQSRISTTEMSVNVYQITDKYDITYFYEKLNASRDFCLTQGQIVSWVSQHRHEFTGHHVLFPIRSKENGGFIVVVYNLDNQVSIEGFDLESGDDNDYYMPSSGDLFVIPAVSMELSIDKPNTFPGMELLDLTQEQIDYIFDTTRGYHDETKEKEIFSKWVPGVVWPDTIKKDTREMYSDQEENLLSGIDGSSVNILPSPKDWSMDYDSIIVFLPGARLSTLMNNDVGGIGLEYSGDLNKIKAYLGKCGFNPDEWGFKEEPQLDNLYSPELTPERLKYLSTIEFAVFGYFIPVLKKFNTDNDLNLQSRSDGYHVTVINPTESKVLASLTSEQIEKLKSISKNINNGIGLNVQGIGFIDGSKRDDLRDVDKNKKTLFLALDIPVLQEFRESIGLSHKDFHITIGYENADIHMQISGKNEKGKDILKPIIKIADPNYIDYSNLLKDISFGPLSGKENEKPKS